MCVCVQFTVQEGTHRVHGVSSYTQKYYRVNNFFEQKEVKRVNQVREDITLFIKTQTCKKKESVRKVKPSADFHTATEGRS